MNKKRALVLSGGGAIGAFQFGAIKFIYEQVKPRISDYHFNLIVGVSVGSLNGVMLAMDKYSTLEKMWDTISNDKVYFGNLKVWSAVWKIAWNAKAILSNDPLKKLIQELVHLKDVRHDLYDFRFGVVSLLSGEYYLLNAHHFSSDKELQNAILASTSMPIVWPPVEEIRTKDNIALTQLVDGGLRNVSPLGDVVDENPDEIVIINCSQEQVENSATAAQNILHIAQRSLTEIAINEIFRANVKQFMKLNSIIEQLPEGVVVKKSNGRVYKKFKSILIEPNQKMGDVLDFSQNLVQFRIQQGYEAARKQFQQLYPEMDFYTAT